MEFEKLQNIIAEVLNIDTDEITMESTFIDDLGADSLDDNSNTASPKNSNLSLLLSLPNLLSLE